MKKEAQPFEFGIIRIADLTYFVNEIPKIINEKVQLGYGMNFLFDTVENWVEFVVRVDFKDSDSGTSILSGSTLTRFSVKNLNGFVNEEDVLVFPNDSVETLFGIAFSHMRAMLSKNAAGTKFNWIIVPIIDAKQLFNDLLQHNVEVMKKLKKEKEVA